METARNLGTTGGYSILSVYHSVMKTFIGMLEVYTNMYFGLCTTICIVIEDRLSHGPWTSRYMC
jgi:hypothetical protein